MAGRSEDFASKREAIVNLLNGLDLSRTATAEDGPRLAAGEEFVDLDHLDRGIQTAGPGSPPTMHTSVPRNAVSADTWQRISSLLAG